MFWGMPYLLIKVAVDDSLPPVFVTWVRVVLGALVLLVLARRRGLLGTLRGRFRWLIVMALVEITLPFTLIAIGEQHVSSSLAAVVIAAAPTFVVLLALRFDRSERAGGLRLAGLALGLGGVAASVGVDVGATLDQLLGGAAILAAAVCYAIGPMVFKRHLADLDPRASMGASLTIAALLLTPLVVITPPASAPSLAASGALLALGLFCTAAALLLYGLLIVEAGAGRALVVTYVNPLVALALGMAILGERPGVGAVIGFPLILAGSWLATRSQRPRRSRAGAIELRGSEAERKKTRPTLRPHWSATRAWATSRLG